ncbi:hypothetical protein [Arenibacter algicola]|uniref:hypothetical protein n=1 Tax=Arenibacter algicola TaxID=616991 RepID=UPI0004DFC517|nr:hypothetical protein [Arenibacter algicola]|tara:strand:- start:15925 stop:16269 length:345 start_codon:yes stop_codon:yes gene_type:complete
MKATLNPSLKLLAVLMCLTLSLSYQDAFAQSTASTPLDIEVMYYVLGGAILVVFIATIFVMRKVAKIAGEEGLQLFDIDFPIFKRMAKSSGIVAIIMILLVLWGIYLVVTYKVK